MPVVIHGKAYKPDVDYLDGSYSLLIGHYLKELGVEFSYSDLLTGDIVDDGTNAVILLAHNRQITYGYTGELPEQQLYFTPGLDSIILDPWRKFESLNYLVIHYGNTRGVC
jgi:UDPglucose 6-dehydrogenase